MSEEFEYIPWSQLANQQRTQRNRTMYIAAGVIAAVAVGALLARSTLGQASAQPQPGAQQVPAATSAPTEQTTTTTAFSSLYSEADLMALVEGEATRAVATRAEWFVHDYFTADNDPSLPGDITAAIESSLAEEISEPIAPTYVEWAKTYEVIETMPGRFRATVVFRTIGGDPYERLAVQAVEIEVAIAGDGGTTIIELPVAVPMPGSSG